MARRDQPYLPLYVQDFLTDEKLSECSAQSTGVYIRLMCLMHKSAQYGCILLKQKDKQNGCAIQDFACKLARQMPYTTDVIAAALEELREEGVIQIDGDVLSQKRMVKDAELSATRASAGKKRQEARKKSDCENFAKAFADKDASDFATAKSQANTENEIESENEDESSKDSSAIEVLPTTGKRGENTFSPDSYAYKLAVYLADRIAARLPTVKPPNEKRLQQWADAFDKCNRLDGHAWDEIKYVLRFSQDDSFWQANILSGKNFRDKYMQLLSKMQQEGQRNKAALPGGTYTSGADRLLAMANKGAFDDNS